MASQPASSAAIPRPSAPRRPHLPAETTTLGRVGQALSRRRVPITIVMGLTLFAIDIVVRGMKPRNLLDLHDLPAMAGLSIALAGLAVRSWAAGTLHKVRSLTTSGPYRHMRNPLYFGSFL